MDYLTYPGQVARQYRKIPKISPGAYIFQRSFLRDLEGLIYWGKSAFQNLPFLLNVFVGNFQVQAPQGAYIWRGDLMGGLMRVFCVTSLGGLYLEGLIFGVLRHTPRCFMLQNPAFLATILIIIIISSSCISRLRHKCNQAPVSNICKAVLRSLFWAPNAFDELISRSAFWMSFQSDWQIEKGFFNRTMMHI